MFWILQLHGFGNELSFQVNICYDLENTTFSSDLELQKLYLILGLEVIPLVG